MSSLNNYQHSPEDYQALVDLGIPRAEINGYQITDGDEQALREFFGNRREMGYEVPEEYQPRSISRKELEMRYQELSMYETELERCSKEEIVDDVSKWDRRGYEEDELGLDEKEKDYVPDSIYNLRRQQERAENKSLEDKKGWARRKRNAEASKRLVEHLNERERRMEEKRRENLKKSKELVEKLKRKEKENEESK